MCRDAGAYVTVQGGRTSLVAGTVPEHDDVLLSTERLCVVSDVDTVERRIEIGAGVTLAAVQHAASTAGLVFGVDLSARDTATVGGMASTNAGGLRTVRYGNMGEQVVGLDVALPDGTVLRRHSRVRRDNTGYDLPALFVGAEGTLGVITALDLRLHPTPSHRVTAVCGFAELAALVDAGRMFRDVEGIAALELIDGRAAALTREHLGVRPPSRLTGCYWWNWPPTTIRPTGSPTCSAVHGCAGSPRSVWMPLRSNGCGAPVNRWPRCSVCTARR